MTNDLKKFSQAIAETLSAVKNAQVLSAMVHKTTNYEIAQICLYTQMNAQKSNGVQHTTRKHSHAWL